MTAEPSELTSFIFLPPYFEDPEFENLRLGGDKVDILWLVPITEPERDYAVENGSKALEGIFQKTKLDRVVDEKRTSLV